MFIIKVRLNAKICVLGIYLKDFIQTREQAKLLNFLKPGGMLEYRPSCNLNMLYRRYIKQQWKKTVLMATILPRFI